MPIVAPQKRENIKYCVVECLPDPMGIVIPKIAWIFLDISKLITWSFFSFFLAPEWRGYRHVLKGCQLRPKLCPHAQSFCFDHAKIRAHNLFMEIYECVSGHVPEALQMSFYSISLHHALAYPNIFLQSIRISNKIISTSELWWVWGRGRGAA